MTKTFIVVRTDGRNAGLMECDCHGTTENCPCLAPEDLDQLEIDGLEDLIDALCVEPQAQAA